MSKDRSEPANVTCAPRLGVHAAVLAGGQSSRFGSDKSLAHLPGDELTFLERVIAACKEVAGRVVIIAPYRSEYAGWADAVIPDIAPDEGPLGGLLTALRECRAPWLLVAACDQPFLTSTVLARLMSSRQEADVVVFESEDGLFNPFPCLFRRATVLPLVEEQFRSGNRSIRAVVGALDRLRLEYAEIGAVDRDALQDIDTVEDLQRSGASLPVGNDSVQ